MTSPEQTKQPYSTPCLHVYGNIREITRGTGRNGSNDTGQGKGNDHSIP
jgi:hypothetical protein